MVSDSSLQSKCKEKYGLCRENVDPRFREPFIMSGYRQPNMKVLDCLRSTLIYYCNETINVWSHFIAFLYFFVKFWKLFNGEISSNDPFLWPLLSYALGIMGFCLMSSIAHTFNSVSPVTRNTCFSLDYAAISIYSVGAGQAFYSYCRPLNTEFPIFQSSMWFSFTSILISIGSTLQCCLTRRKWHPLKYVLRTLAFVMPFLINVSPFLHRILFGNDIDSCEDVLPMFMSHTVYYILAAIANVTRVPERILPGSFDILGQSHHIMHVFTAIGASIQFEVVRTDMLNRKALLLQRIDPVESSNTIWYMAIAAMANISIALWFGMTSSNQVYDKKKANKGK